ncbi:hypothetical protein ACFFU9_07915 [Mariniflexile ostreae]|uniref:Uncharacterized protein n=1 Tax=Mariniflexile ostreae TaxID=1520892 RepID=A0ABV5FB35_9FLAO
MNTTEKTPQTKFKRVLVFENTERLKNIVEQIKPHKPYLNALKESYELLEIGDFTNDKYIELITKGTLITERRYKEFLNSELEKLGVKSSVLKGNLLNESDDSLDNLKESLKALKSFRVKQSSFDEQLPPLKLESITYANIGWVFYVSNESREAISEMHCKTYLESEDEQKLYESINAIAKAYDKFLDDSKALLNLDFRFDGLGALKQYIDDPIVMRKHDKNYNKKTLIRNEWLLSFIRYNKKQ